MTAAVNLPTLRLLRVAIDLMDGAAPLELNGLAPGQWREVDEDESQRLERLLKPSRAMGKISPGPVSPGRGGRAGGGKSGRGAGGG
jgi:23S rRNA pseudouridine2457 synthase